MREYRALIRQSDEEHSGGMSGWLGLDARVVARAIVRVDIRAGSSLRCFCSRESIFISIMESPGSREVEFARRSRRRIRASILGGKEGGEVGRE